MNSLKISVIIPLYNAENTIEKCLDSVAIQKPNYEIEVKNPKLLLSLGGQAYIDSVDWQDENILIQWLKILN